MALHIGKIEWAWHHVTVDMPLSFRRGSRISYMFSRCILEQTDIRAPKLWMHTHVCTHTHMHTSTQMHMHPQMHVHPQNRELQSSDLSVRQQSLLLLADVLHKRENLASALREGTSLPLSLLPLISHPYLLCSILGAS